MFKRNCFISQDNVANFERIVNFTAYLIANIYLPDKFFNVE